VDLTTGQAERWQPDPALYREWIGGSSLAAKLVWDRLGVGLGAVDPFDPANPIMVMTGPLTDSRLPGLPRFTVSARSPLTGLWSESNCGGYFGAECKFAGYDGLVISGAAAEPSYLLVVDDYVKLIPAHDLWGQDAYATNDVLAARHALALPDGRQRAAQVMAIGPAGEHRVRFAALLNHKHHLSARGGLGAVFGSKHLKAVVCVGSGGAAPPADPAALRAIRWRMLARIKDSLVIQTLGELGTSGALELGMYEGDVPVINWRETPDWHEAAQALGGTALADSILVGRHTCYACPIACKRTIEIREGKYKTPRGAGPESETVAAFGTLLGNANLEAVAHANDLCNRWGMDTISCGATIACAVECFEQGLLTPADTGGLVLRWGDVDTALALIPLIATRSGFGAWLADGSAALVARLGPAAAPFLTTVKGLEAPMHDPRAVPGLGLSYATAPGGASHTADLTYPLASGTQRGWGSEVGGGGLESANEGSGIRDQGSDSAIRNPQSAIENPQPPTPNPQPLRAAQDVIAAQDANQVYGMALAFCHLAGRAFDEGDILDAAAAVTGQLWTMAELLAAGARIWYLKRVLSWVCGARAVDDALPARLTRRRTPRPDDAPAVDLPALLAAFYALRDLDAEGRPSADRLRAVGLGDVAATVAGVGNEG
jgi:aldehyde:ferredoxin oxidoreductase